MFDNFRLSFSFHLSCFWPYLNIVVTKNVTFPAQKNWKLIPWIKSISNKGNKYLVVFDMSLYTKFQNIAQEKTSGCKYRHWKKLRTCMFLPVICLSGCLPKKINLFQKIWFVILSLKNVTIKADSFEIITMVRYLCFSRVSFSLHLGFH